MVKKNAIKKPRKPRKTRAKASAKTSKDKSVKQITNVNVTSSGGGGSGGASVPSPIQYQHPLMTASTIGQKVGENQQIKNLTDLLTKTLAEKKVETKPEIKPEIKPAGEANRNSFAEIDVFDYETISSKSSIPSVFTSYKDTNNQTLLQNINTPIIQDFAEIANEPKQQEDAQHVNADEYFIKDEDNMSEISLDTTIDNPIYKSGFDINEEKLQDYKQELKDIIQTSVNEYKQLGANKPLLFDKKKEKYFKIIETENGPEIIYWNSKDSAGPLKTHIQNTIKQYYSKGDNYKEINNDYENKEFLNTSFKPSKRLMDIEEKYFENQKIKNDVIESLNYIPSQKQEPKKKSETIKLTEEQIKEVQIALKKPRKKSSGLDLTNINV